MTVHCLVFAKLPVPRGVAGTAVPMRVEGFPDPSIPGRAPGERDRFHPRTPARPPAALQEMVADPGARLRDPHF